MDHVRKLYPVLPGDLILTGTPAGVAALKAGDVCSAQVVTVPTPAPGCPVAELPECILSSGKWTVVRR